MRIEGGEILAWQEKALAPQPPSPNNGAKGAAAKHGAHSVWLSPRRSMKDFSEVGGQLREELRGLAAELRDRELELRRA